jgi:hypothetical protein
MKPSTIHGASFGDDNGGGVAENPQEPHVRPSTNSGASGKSRCYKWYSRMGHPNRADMKRRVADMPKSCDTTAADVDDVFEVNKLIMRPLTMSGASFSEGDDGDVPETHDEHCILPSSLYGPSIHGATFADAVASLKSLMNPRKDAPRLKGGGDQRVFAKRRPVSPNSTLRPSTTRGASFADDDDSGIPEAPQEPLDNPPKRKRGMRPSNIRGASFDSDDGSVVERPQVHSMRPSTMRGASFEDDNCVPEKPYDLQDNIIMPKRGVRPSTTRGASFGDDDGGGISEAPQEPFDSSPKRKRGMRPSNIRGASFGDDDDDGGCVPEKPAQEPDARASIIHGALLVDENGPTQSPVKHVENQLITSDPKPADTADTATTEIIIGEKSRAIDSVPPKEKSAVELEKLRKCKECYEWYTRMGHPNRAYMKRHVADMPVSCDITADDVDELPWTTGGKRLSVIGVNKLILGDN